MQKIGFGTFRIKGEGSEKIIESAIECGYRYIDTATVYRNEEGIGNTIKRMIESGLIQNHDIYISSKLSPRDHGYQQTIDSVYKSLSNLQTDFIDLYFIHWPGIFEYFTKGKSGLSVDDRRHSEYRKQSYQALEQLYVDGKIKSIGVSNYTLKHLQELYQYCKIPPMVLQVEFHPLIYQTQRPLLEYCQQHSIIFQAYSSFGEGALFSNQELCDLSIKYQKTISQILLQWALQHGVYVIPKSSSIEHQKDNLFFSFELSDMDMQLLDNFEYKYGTTRYCWDPTVVQ